jgi:hypothetical protein
MVLRQCLPIVFPIPRQSLHLTYLDRTTTIAIVFRAGFKGILGRSSWAEDTVNAIAASNPYPTLDSLILLIMDCVTCLDLFRNAGPNKPRLMLLFVTDLQSIL